MTKQQAAALTANRNVQDALVNYIMWIENYPMDFKGATDAASDFIDTTAEVDELARCLKTLTSR